MDNLKKNGFLIAVVVVCGILIGLGISARFQFEQTGKATQKNTPVTTNEQAPTMTQLNQDFVQISEKVTPTVVSISTNRAVKKKTGDENSPNEEFLHPFFRRQPDQQPDDDSPSQRGLGSGVIVNSEKGYILTNNHVVEDADQIEATLADGRQIKARIIGTDPKTDLAVIQLKQTKGLHAIELGDSNKLRVGEWVLAIGNPFGLSSTITAGIISAKGRADVGVADFEDFIQTDAAINPGNSGGALININGELVGINTAIATRTSGYMGIGFAIPVNMAQTVMAALIEKGKVSRSQLGVYIRQMDEVLAKSLGMENIRGIVVTDVMADSSADKAGMKKYDVILQLNGQDVDDVNHFRNAIALTAPGTNIELKVQRDGKILTLKPNLKEAGLEKPVVPPTEEALPGSTSQWGFEVQTLTPNAAKQLGIVAGTEGVLVARIDQTSRAYEQGLRRGDIITELNRKRIRNEDDFMQIAGKLKSGDTALLSVQRENASFILAFEIE